MTCSNDDLAKAIRLTNERIDSTNNALNSCNTAIIRILEQNKLITTEFLNLLKMLEGFKK